MNAVPQHTPGPFNVDMGYIVAPDPTGKHPDIYLAEMATEDEEGRIASPEQQAANERLFAAAPDLLAALRSFVKWAELHGLDKGATVLGSDCELPVVTNANRAISLAMGEA